MADMNTAARKKAAAAGQAMPGGRFPVKSRADLEAAIRAVGRVRPDTEEARAQVRRFLIKRAKAIGATDALPETWAADGSLKS
jgi:hypothetical protein